jgi:cellulose synthase/poly-beta-1,6-N-acetylglucosamine synthase-like glycosyltransferase
MLSLSQNMTLATVGISSFVLFFYTYFGYPLVLFLVNIRKRGASQNRKAEIVNPPRISIIIPARNSEEVIAHKLGNTLGLEYYLDENGESLVQVLVLSDASEDETDDIVKRYRDKGVQLIRLEVRGGKEQAQATAIAYTTGDIIVFTDVRAVLKPDALQRIALCFQDESIGGLSSVDCVTGGGEALYVGYEMWLRRQETRFGSLVGLSGSCFALRKALCKPWHLDVPSDFFSALNVYQAGFRTVLADDVPCSYGVQQSNTGEYSRKVRTVLRGMTALFRYSQLMNPAKHPRFAFQLISHKLFRWLAPIFLLVGAVCVGMLLQGSLLIAYLSGLYLLVMMALFGYFVPAFQQNFFFKVPMFFLLSNIAIFAAWVKYLKGERISTWNPTKT